MSPQRIEEIRRFTYRYGYTSAHYAPDVALFFDIPEPLAIRVIHFFYGT